LRRADVSLAFRSHGVISLATVLQAALDGPTLIDNAEYFTIIERVCHSVEVNLVMVQCIEDGEMLFSCLVRLCGEAMRVMLSRYTKSVTGDQSPNMKRDLDAIFNRFLRAWNIIREAYFHESLQFESINLLLKCVPYYDIFQEKMSMQAISDAINTAVNSCFISNNIGTLEKVVETIEKLGIGYVGQVMEVSVHFLMAKILSRSYLHGDM
jgi:hypothetical protein